MAITKDDIVSGIGAALAPLGGGLGSALAGKGARAVMSTSQKQASEEMEETPQQRSERMDEMKREARGVKKSRMIEIPPELKAKGGKVYSIDGIAQRGKTRAKQK